MIRIALALIFTATLTYAQEATDEPMTAPRVAAIAEALDPDAKVMGNGVQMTIADVPVLIVMDPVADRMRAMVPIRDAAAMTAEELARVMQANFDTALDARYAIARGRLWAVFIHPLSPLERDQLISGIGQTVNIALTYGSVYSGGAMSFGGGDSGSLLLEELLKRGQEL
ncbi:MAG: hypothetical protein AAGA47_14025 [Pseudomonadota bacterium]